MRSKKIIVLTTLIVGVILGLTFAAFRIFDINEYAAVFQDMSSNLDDNDIAIFNFKLSSDDLKFLNKTEDTDNWRSIDMLQGSKEFKIDIRRGKNEDEEYQIRIDDVVYRIYKINNKTMGKYLFSKSAESARVDGTSPQLVQLHFNEVDMGNFIIEEKIYEQVRDDKNNYFITLSSDTHLMRKLYYDLENGFEEAIDFFNNESLARYMALFDIFSEDKGYGFDKLFFMYKSDTDKLAPYVTMDSAPNISDIQYDDIAQNAEVLLNMLMESNSFHKLINTKALEYLDNQYIVENIKDIYIEFSDLVAEEHLYNIEDIEIYFRNQAEKLRIDIGNYMPKIHDDKVMEIKYGIDSKWHYLNISHKGGFYTDPFQLIFETDESFQVYYTLDGSEPSKDDFLYTGPIEIKNRTEEQDILSMIKETSTSWLKPKTNSFKGTVVRCIVYKDGKPVSDIVTNTYFVDNDIFKRYSFPVISLTTDSENFFDKNKGIYVLGRIREDWLRRNPGQEPSTGTSANYTRRGKAWERPVHMEWFEPDGSLGFSQNLGIRINGGWSRSYPLKPLKLYARGEYDEENSINYEIFPGLKQPVENGEPIEEFKCLLLRNSGHDFILTMFEDAMTQSLMENTNLDTQAYRPGIIFLNGEYWGIHNVRERQDEHYLESHYGVPEENIVLLENFYQILHGNEEDKQHYLDMIKFLQTHDIREKETYEYIKTQMDVNNYIDFNIIEIFIVNLDWPGNNTKYWRYKGESDLENANYGHDGKWRWLLFDTEGGFRYYDFDMLTYATMEGMSTGLNTDRATFLFRTLLKNEEFKKEFIARFADLLNNNLKEERINNKIDEMKEKLEPEIIEHINRWHYPGWSVNGWNSNIGILRTFAKERPKYVRKEIVNFFNLDGTAKGIIEVSDNNAGYFKVNDMEIKTDNGIYEGVYFQGIPITITAIPNEGYAFNGWDGIEGNENSITFIPNQDFKLKIDFIKKD